MKKTFPFILAFMAIASLPSCFKTAVKLPSLTPKTPDSTTLLLTGQTWVYYEYFTNFDSSNTLLAWKTGRTSNNLNLALNQVKFNTDSTYSEIDQNGNVFNGTWSYLNNETGVSVVNSEGTFISTIESLTSQRYEWLAPNGTYGVMVPKNQVIDTTGGKLKLLTSKTWVYQEYFYNFDLTAPALVWKTNKADVVLNLSQNIVKYDTAGTYTETDQNGNIYNGTWTFLNNQTAVQVVNSLGTFTSTIEVLDSARFEWLEIDGSNHYGEMIPK